MNQVLTFLLVNFALLACKSGSGSAPAKDNNALQKSGQLSATTIPLCQGLTSIKGIRELPPPNHWTGIGNSHLSITTTSPEARQWFDQGLNLLHGFWHLEAYRAFRQVVRADSACAMGYWGIAMCQPGFSGNEPVWRQAIYKADSLKHTASPLEVSLIEAGSVLITQGIEAAQTSFRSLYKTYPNEPEAIAFAAIILRQHQADTTQQEVKTLLEKALSRFPHHIALAHYYIHVMELRPDFIRASQLARQMAKLAPNSPHLQHMPGHLYYLAGAYEQAIGVYQQARRQEEAYHNAQHIPFTANQNYIHNLQFLAVAQAETNEYALALQTATQLASLAVSPDLPNEGAAQMLLYEGRIQPALVHIRYGAYQKAALYLQQRLNSLDQPISQPLVRTYLEAMRYYCLGMEATVHQQPELAKSYVMGMFQQMKAFEQVGMQLKGSGEFKLVNETWDILSMARYELAGWLDNIDPKSAFNGAAWQEALSLEGLIKYDEPPRLLYPVAESLARLHLYRKEKKLAQQAVKQALLRRPRSRVLLGLQQQIQGLPERGLPGDPNVFKD